MELFNGWEWALALAQSPTLYKLWNPSFQEVEDQKFSFDYIVNSTPARATVDPVSEELVL